MMPTTTTAVGLLLTLFLVMPAGLVQCRAISSPKKGVEQGVDLNYVEAEFNVETWKKNDDIGDDKEENMATDKLLKNSQEFEEDLFMERGLIAEKVGSIWETTGETRTFVALKFSSFTGILPESELSIMATESLSSSQKSTELPPQMSKNMSDTSKNNARLKSDNNHKAMQQMIVCKSLKSAYKTFVEASKQLGEKKNLFNYLKSRQVLDKHLEQSYDYMMTTCRTTGRRNYQILDKFREELKNNGLNYRLKSVTMGGGEPNDEDDNENEMEDDDDYKEEDNRKQEDLKKVNKAKQEKNGTKTDEMKQRMIENIDENTGIRPRDTLAIVDLALGALDAVEWITNLLFGLFVDEVEINRWKDLGTYHDFAGWERHFLDNVQKTAEMSSVVFDRLLEEIFHKHTLNRAFFDNHESPSLELKNEKVRAFYRRLLDDYHFIDTVYDSHPLEALKLLRVHPIQWDNKEQALIVEVIAPTYRTQKEPEDLYDVQHIGTLLRQPTIEEPEGYRRIKFPPMIATPSFGNGPASRLALYLSSRPVTKEMYESVCIKIASNVYCPDLSNFRLGCNIADITGCDYDDVNFIDYKNRAKKHYYTVHHLNSAVKVVRSNCPGKTALEWQANNVIDDSSSSSRNNNDKQTKEQHSSKSNDDDTWSSFDITDNVFKIRVPKGSRLRVCGKIVFKGRDNLIRASAASIKLSNLYKKIHFEAAQKLQISTTTLIQHNRVASANGTRLDGTGGYGLSRISSGGGTGFFGRLASSIFAGPIAALESLLNWILYIGGILIVAVIGIVVALKLLWAGVCHSLPLSINLCVRLIKGLRKTAMRNAENLLNDTKQRLRSMKNHQAIMFDKVLPAKLTNEMLKTMANGYSVAAKARNDALSSIEEEFKNDSNEYGGEIMAPNMYPSARLQQLHQQLDNGNNNMEEKMDNKLINLIRVLKNEDLTAYLNYLRRPELFKKIKTTCKKRIRAARRKFKKSASVKLRQLQKKVSFAEEPTTDNDNESEEQMKEQWNNFIPAPEFGEGIGKGDGGEREMEDSDYDDDNVSELTDKSVDTVAYEEPNWWDDVTPDLLEFMENADLKKDSKEEQSSNINGNHPGRGEGGERKEKKAEKDAQSRMRLNFFFNRNHQSEDLEMNELNGQQNDDNTSK